MVQLSSNDTRMAYRTKHWIRRGFRGEIRLNRAVMHQKDVKNSNITYPIALSFTNDQPYERLVEVYLASQNQQNIISTTTTLHHYDRPQWVFFGVAVVLISLGAISVFKSKR